MPDSRGARLLALFEGSVTFTRAPGRVNLIGDHTDYQDGLCMPVAIDRDVLLALQRHHGDTLTARSLEVGGALSIDLRQLADPLTCTPRWGAVAAGAVLALRELGIAVRGGQLAVSSTVPIGSGLSSSAALGVALCRALSVAAAQPLEGTNLARAAQRAEHLSGVPCGLLDQMASVHGAAGHALLLDCRSLTVEPVAMPSNLAIIVAHCGMPRALADSAYAERRAACAAAATRIGVATLRDAAITDVRDEPFARHVVSENARVLEFAAALRAGDGAHLGAVMDASHRSLAVDFGVSTPALDRLAAELRAAGAFGARLTGAGFGGCVVALAPAARATHVMSAAVDRYRAATSLVSEAFVAHAVDGATTLSAPPED